MSIHVNRESKQQPVTKSKPEDNKLQHKKELRGDKSYTQKGNRRNGKHQRTQPHFSKCCTYHFTGLAQACWSSQSKIMYLTLSGTVLQQKQTPPCSAVSHINHLVSYHVLQYLKNIMYMFYCSMWYFILYSACRILTSTSRLVIVQLNIHCVAKWGVWRWK